jgi:hypothetical protein
LPEPKRSPRSETLCNTPDTGRYDAQGSAGMGATIAVYSEVYQDVQRTDPNRTVPSQTRRSGGHSGRGRYWDRTSDLFGVKTTGTASPHSSHPTTPHLTCNDLPPSSTASQPSNPFATHPVNSWVNRSDHRTHPAGTSRMTTIRSSRAPAPPLRTSQSSITRQAPAHPASVIITKIDSPRSEPVCPYPAQKINGPPRCGSRPSTARTSTGCRARRHHSANIAGRSTVGIDVSDSTVAVRGATTVKAEAEAEAEAEEVGPDDRAAALAVFNGRAQKQGIGPWSERDVSGAAQFRIYRAPRRGSTRSCETIFWASEIQVSRSRPSPRAPVGPVSTRA